MWLSFSFFTEKKRTASFILYNVKNVNFFSPNSFLFVCGTTLIRPIKLMWLKSLIISPNEFSQRVSFPGGIKVLKYSVCLFATQACVAAYLSWSAQMLSWLEVWETTSLLHAGGSPRSPWLLQIVCRDMVLLLAAQSWPDVWRTDATFGGDGPCRGSDWHAAPLRSHTRYDNFAKHSPRHLHIVSRCRRASANGTPLQRETLKCQ